MLDMKFVRDHLDDVREMLKNRCNPLDLGGFAEMEKRRREILNEVEQLKGQRNTVSKQISVMKKNRENRNAPTDAVRYKGRETMRCNSRSVTCQI